MNFSRSYGGLRLGRMSHRSLWMVKVFQNRCPMTSYPLKDLDPKRKEEGGGGLQLVFPQKSVVGRTIPRTATTP